jgi:hypothetical protein
MVPGTIVFIAVLAVELYYQQAMLDFSLGPADTPFTLLWWQTKRFKVMNIIMLGFTNLVNPNAIVGILIVALFIAFYQIEVFLFLQYAAFSCYLLMTCKSILHQPRPYMINTAIIPLEKYAEYGNPSGHVWLGYVWVTYVFETFLYCHRLWMDPKFCKYGCQKETSMTEGSKKITTITKEEEKEG